MQAPGFELRDAEGTLWRLSDLRGEKVILFFYPADDTPGCTAEACDFRDARQDLEEAGFVVLGVSPQGAESHRAFANKHSLNFPLLIDDELEAARAYDVVLEESRMFDGLPILTKRSTFVIDESGRLVHAEYGVRSRGHIEALRQGLSV